MSSVELRTFKKHIRTLNLAVRSHIIPLAENLLAEELISLDNYCSLTTAKDDEVERAAKLLSFVLIKVELSPRNYHVFVKVLISDRSTYKEVLNVLEPIYKEPNEDFSEVDDRPDRSMSGTSCKSLTSGDHRLSLTPPTLSSLLPGIADGASFGADFMLPVYRYTAPGCKQETSFDPNTGDHLSLYCYPHHFQSYTQLQHTTSVPSFTKGCQSLSQSFFSGHQQPVMSDLNESDEKTHAKQYRQQQNGCMQQACAGTLQDPSLVSLTQSMYPFIPTPPPGSTKCAIPECHKAAHVDKELGKVHLCCSRTHAREFEERGLSQGPTSLSPSLTPPPPLPSLPPPSLGHPPTMKCAIIECPKPCYKDESGTVHECCGLTHAMEHQRRLALMKQTNQQVVKGVTHCSLPGCNQPTWPFMNYCRKSHAEEGKRRGLPPPPSLTSGPAAGSGAAVTAAQKTSSMCLIPECSQPKYVDQSSGVTHDFCGKSHADEGKIRGIRSQAEKAEEECELPGCENRKRTERTRVHDYCCMDHATQDAPNRAARILTSHSEVQKFLKKFSDLTVVSLEENSHAKPGGQLFNRFKNAHDKLPKTQRNTCLAFHGTLESNIQSICSNGYDPKLRGRNGQAYGAGEYFVTKPDTPMSYCRGGKKMLLNELLLGQSGTHHTQTGDIVVMKDPDHDLPRYVITFK